MIYKNKTYQLKEYLDDIDTNYKTKDFISIKLRLTNNYFNANEIHKLLGFPCAFQHNLLKIDEQNHIGFF